MELMRSGPKEGPVYVFAHGAGASMNSAFMSQVAAGLSERGVHVVRFNFPYMVKREEDGKRRPPDRAPKLIEAYEAVIKYLDCPVIIGGKSMGGRMSSMLLAKNSQLPKEEQLTILGSACLGFPFHAPGKDPKDRLDHLVALTAPLLIVQGTRDTMGTQAEVTGYFEDKRISDSIEVNWLEDGNHDLKPRIKSGFSHLQHIESAIDQVAKFVFKQHSNT